MSLFKKTSYLSEILQASDKEPVIIYKHSNICVTSTNTEIEIAKNINDKIINYPVYIVVVQEMSVLSRNIEQLLNVKHESPQVIVIEKGKVKYAASHRNINMKDIISLLP